MASASRPDYGQMTALVFDSGVGGLTVAEALRTAAPELTIHYAADTGFFPYGDKSDAALRTRIPKVAKALFDVVEPDAFVIACNTASTLALSDVRAALPIPVVGTVPAIKPAARLSSTGVIGLLATPGTIRRRYTDELIGQFARDAEILKLGSIDLVRLAEAVAHGEDPPLADFAAAQAPLFTNPQGERIDTIVLACTHFPLIRNQLIATAPHPVAYIDSGDAIARQTLRVLMDCTGHRQSVHAPTAYVTDRQGSDIDLSGVFSRFGFSLTSTVSVRSDPDSAQRDGSQ